MRRAIYQAIHPHIPVNIEKPTNPQFKFILDILKQVSNVREALKKITDPKCILRKPENPSWFGIDEEHHCAEIDAICCQYLKYTGELPPTFEDLQSFVNRNLGYDYDISSGKAHYDNFVSATSNKNSSNNKPYDVGGLKYTTLRFHGNIISELPDHLFNQEILPKLGLSILSLKRVSYKSSIRPEIISALAKVRKSIHNRSSAEIDELIQDIGSKECEIIELNLSNIQVNYCNTKISLNPGSIELSLLQFNNLKKELVNNTSIKILYENNSIINCDVPKSVTHLYLQNNKMGPDYMAFTINIFNKYNDRQSSLKLFEKLLPNLKYLDLSHTDTMDCTDLALDILAETSLECLRIKGFRVYSADDFRFYSADDFVDHQYIKPEEVKLPEGTKLKIVYI